MDDILLLYILVVKLGGRSAQQLLHVATCRPIDPTRVIRVGQKLFANLEKLTNGWTHWHHIWQRCSDSSGNRHKLNKNYRTAGPNGT